MIYLWMHMECLMKRIFVEEISHIIQFIYESKFYEGIENWFLEFCAQIV